MEIAYGRLGRDNGLNLIRLLLAVLVIISHAYPIAGFGPDPAIGDLGFGSLAVGGFLAISGYLITKSRFRTGFKKFALARALRIFPGYWVCLIFTAFVGAGFAGLLRGGWSLSEAIQFVAFNVPMVRAGGSDIGSTLAGLPYSDAWNGSLWTLRYEVLCYVVVGLMLTFGFVRKLRLVAFSLAFAAVSAFSLAIHARGIEGPAADLALLAPFFTAGACLYVYSDKIPCSRRWAVASLALFLIAVASGTGRSLAALPLAYLLMWLGVVLPRAVRRLGQNNDLSYGTYLYAFPVQQLLVMVGAHTLGPVAFILLSIVATAPLAALSWFLVEKRANELARLRGREAPQSRA